MNGKQRARIGVDFHTVDGKYQGSRSHLLGLYREIVVQCPEWDFFLYLDGVDELRDRYQEFRGTNVFVRRMKASSAPFRLTVQLAMLARKDGLDILHVQYIRPMWTPCKVIATIHDVLFESHPEYFTRRFVVRSRILVRWTARTSTHLLAVSEYSKREIEARYKVSSEKVSVVYNAPPAAGTTPKESVLERIGVAPQEYALTVGRLEPRKNHLRLLEAWRGASTGRKLVVVGQADFGAERILEAIREAVRRGEAVFVNDADDNDVACLYANARFFLYPSVAEGFGMPPLEAMAAGLPVISSDAPALREVLANSAVFVSPFDVKGWIAAIRALDLDARMRSDLSARGRARAREFSWRREASHMKEAYQNVLSQ